MVVDEIVYNWDALVTLFIVKSTVSFGEIVILIAVGACDGISDGTDDGIVEGVREGLALEVTVGFGLAGGVLVGDGDKLIMVGGAVV